MKVAMPYIELYEQYLKQKSWRIVNRAVMDEQTTFETFLQQRIESLADRLKATKHDFSNEHIRRLRVGIKRWRTLYRLITALHPQLGKSDKLERSVKRLFKRAGRVRDNQLNRQLLVGLGLTPALEKHVERYYKKQEKKARKRLKKVIKSFPAKRLRKIGKQLRRPGMAVDALKITDHLGQLMNQEAHAITTPLPAEVSHEQLHTVRKQLKVFIEMGEVMSTVQPATALTTILQHAKAVQRRLGSWHDYTSLIDHLNDFIARHPSVLPPKSVRLLERRFDRLVRQRTKRVRHRVDEMDQWLPSLTS